MQVGKYKRPASNMCHAPILEWSSLIMLSLAAHSEWISVVSVSTCLLWPYLQCSNEDEQDPCRVSSSLGPYDKKWQHLISSVMDYYTEIMHIPFSDRIQRHRFASVECPMYPSHNTPRFTIHIDPLNFIRQKRTSRVTHHRWRSLQGLDATHV